MTCIYSYDSLLAGTLVRRYKRFLADVELPDKSIITVFCPNSGSMKSCSAPGSEVMLSPSNSPTRKTKFTLEMVKVGETWIGVNTLLTNHLVNQIFALGLTDLIDYRDLVIKREVSVKDSRLDFLLINSTEKMFVEVKSVTLQDGNNAKFPDAVTTRGTKHLNSLMNLVKEGYRACILYLVQRDDCDAFAPAEQIDPIYAKTLKLALQNGVEIRVYMCEVQPNGISFKGNVPLAPELNLLEKNRYC